MTSEANRYDYNANELKGILQRSESCVNKEFEKSKTNSLKRVTSRIRNSAKTTPIVQPLPTLYNKPASIFKSLKCSAYQPGTRNAQSKSNPK